jgi:uncharacterized protein (DUF1800 family)
MQERRFRRSRWGLLTLLCLCAALIIGGTPKHAQNLPPSPDVVRFLEEATFGPTYQDIARVQEIGIPAYLDEQFSSHYNRYPDPQVVDPPFTGACADGGFCHLPATRPGGCNNTCNRDNYTFYLLQKLFFQNALYAPDQLRQRVAFALSQILVTSGVGDIGNRAFWMVPYQNLFIDNAFGNYRDILYNVTLSPAMGNYLDMVNNRCQTRTPPDVNVCRNGLAVKPNENYAREILQLFSVGLYMLNQDGTLQLDADGNPIPTYGQDEIEEFSRVFTGWIFAPVIVTGVVNYRDPMVQNLNGAQQENWHDFGPKTLLNGFQVDPLQDGLTADQELRVAINNIIEHPNVAPFISRRLIQQLVTSNPSPGYIERVANVFTAYRDSTTQLQEVVRTILLDPEARGDSQPDLNYGKLREPVLFITNLLRAFNATSDGVLTNLNLGGGYLIGALQMEQPPYQSPTVFNFFLPDNQVAGTDPPVFAPELQIYSSVTALRRANFVQRIVFQNIPPAPPDREGTSIDLQPIADLAGDPALLVNTLNERLMHSAMSADMQRIITDAVSAIPESNPLLRARTAVYLAATSSQYQVQR